MGVWVVVLVGAALLVPRFTEGLTGSSLEVTGSESAHVAALLAEEFDTPVTEDALVVFDSAELRSDSAAYRQAVADVLGTLSEQAGVVEVENPYASGDDVLFARDGRTVLAPVGLAGDERARQEAAPSLQEVLDAATAQGPVRADLTGSSALNAAVVERQDEDIARAESVGLPIALIVLVLAFGTLVAAGLPLLLGMAAVLTAFGVLGALSGLVGFDAFVQATVTMLGLALGIDYCLFAVSRQREELAARGGDVEGSVGATMATAGKAVLFSGCTVIISVAGLMVVRAPVFRTMALGVMVAVAAMLLIGLTLLPAVLGLLGTRVDRLAIPGRRRSAGPADVARSRWARWTGVVMRRPVLVGGVTSAVLLLAVVPVGQLRLGFDVGAAAVSDTPAGRGYQLVDEKFAPGAATPLGIVVRTSEGELGDAELAALGRFTDRLLDHPEVSEVVSLGDVLTEDGGRADAATLRAARAADTDGALARLLSRDASATALLVMSRSPADSQPSLDLVRWIRDTAAPESLGEVPGLSARVGGLSGQIVDVADEVARATPLVLLIVSGLSFLLLLLAFRSLLLPLGAIAMNLLSVGAAFGLLTLVFQEGHGASLFGAEGTGFVQVYLPLLTFVVLFGLSMDYEVFLISRIKEEWGRGRDNTRAVVAGVAHTAKVITAAAAIMVVVFAAFMLTEVSEIKQLGFALSVAVLLDATLVRVVLVPALMRLSGRHNWWLPRWLDRALPRLELTEGRPGEAPAPAADRTTA
ncbi:MMPL family transporter [Streptomyces hainanensis]|uniref:MMPL family transporter n=1 Tax=Streptomyces hainanensis TaxID=402648 RepID=UPI001404B044|nr:MMPL family transporter [Streptomyces hainanensis]